MRRFKLPKSKTDFIEVQTELAAYGIVVQKYNLKLYIENSKIGLCDARKIRYVHYEEVK
jgi:hypothetical protein